MATRIRDIRIASSDPAHAGSSTSNSLALPPKGFIMSIDNLGHEPNPGPPLARRTIITGAAWSIPAIAVSVAAPASAAASGPLTPASLRIDTDCLLGVAGVTVGFGFAVSNTGQTAYAGGVNVSERIVLSGLLAAPGVRVAVWLILAIEGILGAGSTGVTRSAWSAPANTGSGFGPYTSTSNRTVTIAGPVAGGSKRSWGYLLGVVNALSALGPIANVAHTASITSPTGNPPVANASASVSWSLVSTTCAA